jgi:hypothetical protein
MAKKVAATANHGAVAKRSDAAGAHEKQTRVHK